jgi:hypothetical protein
MQLDIKMCEGPNINLNLLATRIVAFDFGQGTDPSKAPESVPAMF